MSKKSELVRGFGLAMSIGAAMDEIRRALGVSEDEFHVLGTPEGRPHLERMIAGLKEPAETPKPTVYLRQLYVGERILLDPTDGTQTIARAKEISTGGIDPDFMNWNLDVPAQATEAMEVGVHEMIVDGSFTEIYGSVDHTLDRLCLTQAQIIGFCVKHRDKLRRDGCRRAHGAFFLFKVGNKYFVVLVDVNSDGRLLVNVRHLSFDFVWSAEYRRRFVLPQLEPLASSVF